MNKWMKQGVTGFVVTSALASAVIVAANNSSVKVADSPATYIGIDAMDYAGGSKLKDRMLQSGETIEVTATHAINA